MSDQFTQVPDVQDLDFQKRSADRLYKTGVIRGINPLRIERVHEEVRFDDLVADITGRTGDKISCPFHGRDSDPSFTLYRGSNDGFCFGCPAGRGYYDHIKFVKEFYSITWVQALKWIEKEYKLPPIADIITKEEEEDEITTEVTFSDLAGPFITRAVDEVQRLRDAELALEYIHVYFAAQDFEEIAEEAKKAREFSEAIKLHYKAAMRLARVLGQEAVNQILDKKERNFNA